MKLSGTFKKDILSIILIIVILCVALVRLGGTDEIPVCWDAEGRVIIEDSKYYILFLPAIAIFMFFLMTYFEKNPHRYNWSMMVKNYDLSEKPEGAYSVLVKHLYGNKLIILLLLLYVVSCYAEICVFSSYIIGCFIIVFIINSFMATWRMVLWKQK